MLPLWPPAFRSTSLTMGPSAPIDRVLEQSRNGAVVLWCYEQQRIRRGDFRLEMYDALRHLAFKDLVIEGQVVERDEMEGQLLPCKLCDRLGELAVDGYAPVAADQNRDLDLWHVWRTLVMI